VHPEGQEPYIISGVSGHGIKELVFAIQKMVEAGWEQDHGRKKAEQARLPDDEGLQ